MDTSHADRDPAPLDRIASLAEPVRRRLYEVVAASSEPVDRDSAAARAGIGRPLAAFHLDRLVAAGLLDVEYRRRSGRTGPGAGRPAKFYLRPRGREVSINLPSRSYDLAADLLATGVERDKRAKTAALVAARQRGQALASAPSAGGAISGGDLVALLETQGYEPELDAAGVIRLRNCPFHALVSEHRELTCALNHALLDGAVSAIAGSGYRAIAQPPEGRCCVAFVPVDGDLPGT